jgi:hypothetical protein
MSESQTQNGSTEVNNEFSALEANNFIRGQKGACLVITEEVQGEDVETVFITVNRTYFEVREFGKPSKCERHTMSAALDRARKNGNTAELAAYQQSALDLESAEQFARDNFELEDKDSKAGFGMNRDQLDEAEEDENLEIASKAADTSEEHGGGW